MEALMGEREVAAEKEGAIRDSGGKDSLKITENQGEAVKGGKYTLTHTDVGGKSHVEQSDHSTSTQESAASTEAAVNQGLELNATKNRFTGLVNQKQPQHQLVQCLESKLENFVKNAILIKINERVNGQPREMGSRLQGSARNGPKYPPYKAQRDDGRQVGQRTSQNVIQNQINNASQKLTITADEVCINFSPAKATQSDSHTPSTKECDCVSQIKTTELNTTKTKEVVESKQAGVVHYKIPKEMKEKHQQLKQKLEKANMKIDVLTSRLGQIKTETADYEGKARQCQELAEEAKKTMYRATESMNSHVRDTSDFQQHVRDMLTRMETNMKAELTQLYQQKEMIDDHVIEDYQSHIASLLQEQEIERERYGNEIDYLRQAIIQYQDDAIEASLIHQSILERKCSSTIIAHDQDGGEQVIEEALILNDSNCSKPEQNKKKKQKPGRLFGSCFSKRSSKRHQNNCYHVDMCASLRKQLDESIQNGRKLQAECIDLCKESERQQATKLGHLQEHLEKLISSNKEEKQKQQKQKEYKDKKLKSTSKETVAENHEGKDESLVFTHNSLRKRELGQPSFDTTSLFKFLDDFTTKITHMYEVNAARSFDFVKHQEKFLEHINLGTKQYEAMKTKLQRTDSKLTEMINSKDTNKAKEIGNDARNMQRQEEIIKEIKRSKEEKIEVEKELNSKNKDIMNKEKEIATLKKELIKWKDDCQRLIESKRKSSAKAPVCTDSAAQVNLGYDIKESLVAKRSHGTRDAAASCNILTKKEILIPKKNRSVQVLLLDDAHPNKMQEQEVNKVNQHLKRNVMRSRGTQVHLTQRSKGHLKDCSTRGTQTAVRKQACKGVQVYTDMTSSRTHPSYHGLDDCLIMKSGAEQSLKKDPKILEGVNHCNFLKRSKSMSDLTHNQEKQAKSNTKVEFEYIDILKQKLAQAKEKCKEFSLKLEESKNNLESDSSLIEQLQDRNQQLENTVQEVKLTYTKLENRHEAIKIKLKQLETNLDGEIEAAQKETTASSCKEDQTTSSGRTSPEESSGSTVGVNNLLHSDPMTVQRRGIVHSLESKFSCLVQSRNQLKARLEECNEKTLALDNEIKRLDEELRASLSQVEQLAAFKRDEENSTSADEERFQSSQQSALVADLQKAINDLKNERDNLKLSLERQKELDEERMAKTLKEAIDDKKNEVEDMKVNIAEKETENSELREANADYKAEIEKLSEDLNEINRTKENLDAKVHEKSKENGGLMEKLSQLTESVEHLQITAATAEELAKKVDILTTENENLLKATQTEDQERHDTGLQEAKASFQEEIAKLSQSLTDINKIKENLETEVREKNEENEDLQEKLSQQRETAKQLQTLALDAEDLNAKVELLTTEKQNLIEYIQRMEEETSQSGQSNNGGFIVRQGAGNDDRDSDSREVKELQAECRNLKGMNEYLLLEKEDLQQKLDEVMQNLGKEEATALNAELTSQIKELQEDKNEMSAFLDALQSENEELREKLRTTIEASKYLRDPYAFEITSRPIYDGEDEFGGDIQSQGPENADDRHLPALNDAYSSDSVTEDEDRLDTAEQKQDTGTKYSSRIKVFSEVPHSSAPQCLNNNSSFPRVKSDTPTNQTNEHLGEGPNNDIVEIDDSDVFKNVHRENGSSLNPYSPLPSSSSTQEPRNESLATILAMQRREIPDETKAAIEKEHLVLKNICTSQSLTPFAPLNAITEGQIHEGSEKNIDRNADSNRNEQLSHPSSQGVRASSNSLSPYQPLTSIQPSATQVTNQNNTSVVLDPDTSKDKQKENVVQTINASSSVFTPFQPLSSIPKASVGAIKREIADEDSMHKDTPALINDKLDIPDYNAGNAVSSISAASSSSASALLKSNPLFERSTKLPASVHKRAKGELPQPKTALSISVTDKRPGRIILAPIDKEEPEQKEKVKKPKSKKDKTKAKKQIRQDANNNDSRSQEFPHEHSWHQEELLRQEAYQNELERQSRHHHDELAGHYVDEIFYEHNRSMNEFSQNGGYMHRFHPDHQHLQQYAQISNQGLVASHYPRQHYPAIHGHREPEQSWVVADEDDDLRQVPIANHMVASSYYTPQGVLQFASERGEQRQREYYQDNSGGPRRLYHHY